MVLPGLIVKKIGMARMIDLDGSMIPVTLLEAGAQKVTKILTSERDGYNGVQVGYYTKPEYRLKKPDIGRLRKAKIDDNFARFKEFSLNAPAEGVELGAQLSVKEFEGIASVDATGVTKGRGFQGATKRWNSAIGRQTHGSRYQRRTGSLGQCTDPGRVFKNRKMPGHMGSTQRTIQNLKIVDIDSENNLIAIKGSVPGSRNEYLILKPSIKKAKLKINPETSDNSKKAKTKKKA